MLPSVPSAIQKSSKIKSPKDNAEEFLLELVVDAGSLLFVAFFTSCNVVRVENGTHPGNREPILRGDFEIQIYFNLRG